MDKRKLNTAEALESGILDIKAPPSDAPKDIQYAHIDDNLDLTESEFAELLDTTGGCQAWQYYGCWEIWKNSDGSYSGELFQYRSKTDSFNNADLATAYKKAWKWNSECYG